MAEVRYTITKDQKPTAEEIQMIRSAKKRQDELLAQGKDDEVYDEDCPSTDPDTSPERYQALLKAVGDRNRRIADLVRKHA